MKSVLCIGIIAILGYVGYCLSGFYIQRKKFFQSLLSFILGIKSDINFSSKNLNDILSKVNYAGRDFNTLISNYKDMLQAAGNESAEKLFNNITILNQEEKEDIFIFFSKLGKLDVFNQIDSIESFICVVKKHYDEATCECKKYSTLYIKLGIIIGAFISLIII